MLRKLAARGDIDRDEQVVLVITGDGLKTLDAVRDTFEAYEINASVEEFQTCVEGAWHHGVVRPAAGGRREPSGVAVTVKIPTQLRGAAGGASEAQLEGETVSEGSSTSLYEPLSASCASASPRRRARCGAS